MVDDSQDEKRRLRQMVSGLGLSHNGFARLARVSERSIRLWLDEENGRPVPGYAWAILDLYRQNLDLERRLETINSVSSKKT